ncbi:hypothetical protein M2139_002688 [Enterococcus sp. PF1-24]|nr:MULTISPECIES: hypothetical protein [unclassified Enterococcus]MDH6365692.1 hypothetical protein [Enterococcus sp. PFB1-1]MDH6402782.1 hypothetical protein [Enterococcus sp. PF1-24]
MVVEVVISVDLEKADSTAIAAIVGGGSADNISYEETVKEFEAQGFTKK